MKKDLINMIDSKNAKVISINKENNTFVCDDGNEYPLLEGQCDISVEELQMQLDKAKIIVKNIIDDGETTDS